MSRLWRSIVLLFGFHAALPTLQAAIFPLNVGRLGHSPGVMEVARDAGFQDVLVTVPVGDKQEYLLDLPETAVYFVRIRQQQQIVWQEAIVALLQNSTAGRRLHITWEPNPQAIRYRIWLSRPPLRTRWLETVEHGVQLNKIGEPWLIRLRAITARGEQLPLAHLHFKWTQAYGQQQSVATKARDIEVDLNAPDDDQVVYEPEDKDLLNGADDGPMDIFIAKVRPPTLPPLQRRHEVFVWLRYLREQFTIDKKDRFAANPSAGLGTGAAGQYFLAPNISLSGAIDTHATMTTYDVGGSQAPNSEQKRIRLHMALGLDLLNTHSRETNWSLNLGPVAGLVQMPLQQNDQKFTDYGIKLAGHHYGSRTALYILFLKSGSREIDGRWIMPWTAWSISPFLGCYLYDTRHSAGAVTGLFRESGLRVGLERDF